MRSIARTTLLITIPVLLAGCTAYHAMQTAHFERRMERATELLARQSDADSLAAAGLLNSVKHPERSMPLILQATEVAPERPDLVSLLISVCRSGSGCNSEPSEQRLRALDASNGAGWMGALVRATSSKDETARDDALAAIGRSERADIYWTTLIARLSRAAVLTGQVSFTETETEIIGVLAAQAIPAYSAALSDCKEDRLQRAENLDICRGVAKAFENGDTYITEMIGVAIAKRVWPENSPEWHSAVEARRTFDYRSKLWEKVDQLFGSESAAEQYLVLCEHNRREQDVLQAQLIAAGLKPNPPPE